MADSCSSLDLAKVKSYSDAYFPSPSIPEVTPFDAISDGDLRLTHSFSSLMNEIRTNLDASELAYNQAVTDASGHFGSGSQFVMYYDASAFRMYVRRGQELSSVDFKSVVIARVTDFETLEIEAEHEEMNVSRYLHNLQVFIFRSYGDFEQPALYNVVMVAKGEGQAS